MNARGPWLVLLFALIAASCVSAGLAVEPCPAPVEDDPVKSLCPGPLDFYMLPPQCPWYVTLDGLGLKRDVDGEADYAALGTPDNIVLSTNDFDYGFSAGGRLLVGRWFKQTIAVEGLFFSIGQSDEFAGVRDETLNSFGSLGSLTSPFSNFGNPAVLGLDYNNFVSIRSQSSLDNVELNVRHRMAMPAGKLTGSFLFGVRYMNVPERFQYRSESELFDLPAVGSTLGITNSVRTETENRLVGPQIGGLLEFYVEDRWWVNFELKGALMNDRAEQRTAYNVVNTVTTGPVVDVNRFDYFNEASDDHTAFLGDLSLTLVYRWTEHFTTRVGYQAIWIENLVLAEENMSRNVSTLRLGPASIQNDGSVVYHGPHAGISLTW